MQGYLISSTKENYNGIEEGFILGGKIAGVCYMADSYKDTKVSSNEAGAKRALMTAGNGHHSVFDHESFSVELTGISKILAMVLNSLGQYTTSEKSGRYTVMSGESEREQQLYDKWLAIYRAQIAKTYDYKTENEVEKLAQENARYILSVFMKTSMVYTTTLRQWSYIKQWCDKMSNMLRETFVDDPGAYFKYRLSTELEELSKLIVNLGLYNENIKDNKNRDIQFLQFGDNINYSHTEFYGDVFKAVYELSFVAVAQSHRHRTLKSIIQFNGVSKSFYVPPVIAGTELEEEWLKDLESIKDYIPQCTLVTVIERGCAEDYIMKMQERLCARAQLEVMEQTKKTLIKFINSEYVSRNIKDKLSMFVDEELRVLPRCESGCFKCTEGCTWKKEHRLQRKV